MLFTRFILLAGVALAGGSFAPAHAKAGETATGAAPATFYSGVADKKADDEVPRPRPTPGPRERVATLVAFDREAVGQKKGETPPRPRPKPGPKDGGEDE